MIYKKIKTLFFLAFLFFVFAFLPQKVYGQGNLNFSCDDGIGEKNINFDINYNSDNPEENSLKIKNLEQANTTQHNTTQHNTTPPLIAIFINLKKFIFTEIVHMQVKNGIF